MTQATLVSSSGATSTESLPEETSRLFGELQDLKRVRVQHHGGASLAEHLYRQAWHRLLAGGDSSEVADLTVAAALTAVLFPGCDAAFWPATGLPVPRAAQHLRRALDETLGGFATAAYRERLRAAATRLAEGYYWSAARESDPAALEPPALPRDLEALCHQPRAGATRPGVPRLVLTPPESHAEHVLLTAAYAALLADHYGADRGTVFVAGLAHHLHNALLPDCGFAGEELLGDDLSAVIAAGRERALGQLPDRLAELVRTSLRHHESIAAPEGRAVSAGDVLDRVLDVKWRTRAAAVTDADILGDLDLVHAGPLKSFQTTLLDSLGLWTA